MKTVVAAGRISGAGDVKYDLSAFMPRKGDVVRFRYTPNDLEVMSVRHTHEGAVAVVHQAVPPGKPPKGGFAALVRDLRIVKRNEKP